MYAKLILIVRLVFGVQLTLNGFNWFVKIIKPYPSMVDFIGGSSPFPADNIVPVMVHLGLFQVVKLTELATGISMLTNQYVPLMLVVIFPTLFSTLVVDALNPMGLRGMLMGVGAFINCSFLMLAYLSRYETMLVRRAAPDPLDGRS